MNLQIAIKLYYKLEQESYTQNLFARANSRYILLGVNEPKENFPPTLESNLNFGSDSLAFSYLSIGCCMFENNYTETENGKEIRRQALEKGAEFIEYNHFYEQNRNELSSYYLLVGALAYYASSQYSKAFILMKKVEYIYETDISILTNAFLRKNFTIVTNTLNKILLDDNYIESEARDEGQTIDDRIQVVLYAKAFASLMDFLYFGNELSLATAKDILNDLLELLEIENEPSMWWIVRLLILIVTGFEENSLWATIPPAIPNSELTIKYINQLIFAKKPVTELFVVQRKALKKVLSEKGAVVSLPTSSGKTRIAEIAILQCLSQDPDVKILYLAPFRSLAYEVENSLEKTFEKIGFVVSQLYGNGQFSQIDKAIIENANILIATPEKAKVILRANDDIVKQIKLVIIDEGHLLDEQERQVRNEVFIEELKKYIEINQGKIILLSAVLPNTEEIAQWITGIENPVFISESERVARQRLGTLEFKNNIVSLEWLGEEKSFNPKFIKPIIPLKRDGTPKKNGKIKPSCKKEAVAHTALKLSGENPLLIFIANARSVLNYAETVLNTMKESKDLSKYNWNNQADWEMFKLVCSENENDENRQILECAEYGILCHKGKMNQELKNVIERLIRNDKPRIIIATMTLGQGVNLGISTIIFAGTKFYDVKSEKWKHIDNKEFWNIAGRAGRAFIDTESKILFAIDREIDSINSFRKKKEEPLDVRLTRHNQYVIDRKDEIKSVVKLKDGYFNSNKMNNVTSGLLMNISRIKRTAIINGIDFNSLLQLIAENDFTYIETDTTTNSNFFDWIDDTLLSIINQYEENMESIDDYFRLTLAYIQAKNVQDLNQDVVLAFLKARCKALTEKLAPDKEQWKAFISSGLPLASAIKLDLIFDEIKNNTDVYIGTPQKIEDKIVLLVGIEHIMRSMPSSAFNEIRIDEIDIDKVRVFWLKGEVLTNIQINDEKGKPKNELVSKICNNYFAYTVSWFLGAIANKFKKIELEEQANVFEELAICCELGLPDIISAKIYLAGIRSRLATKEIRETFIFLILDYEINQKISDIKNYILEKISDIRNEVKNKVTLKWLDFFEEENQEKTKKKIERFPDIVLEQIKTNRLFIRKFGYEIYLCSADYKEKINVESTSEFPFSKYVSRNNVFFEFDDGKWKLREL